MVNERLPTTYTVRTHREITATDSLGETALHEEHSESPRGRTEKAQVGEAATRSPSSGSPSSDILAQPS